MSPIIPVAGSFPESWLRNLAVSATPSDITKGYLHFFEPDTFIETTRGQLDAAGLKPKRAWSDQTRYRSTETLVKIEPGRRPYFGLGLAMPDVYEHLYRKEFQFQKKVDPRILMFEGGDPIARAFFEACYGLFPEADSFPGADGIGYIEQFYQQAFAAESVEPSVEVWEQIERGETGFPLNFTIYDLDQRFNSDWNDTIFVFDPLDAGDVIDFWNLRQFRRDVMPVNVHWLAQSRALIAERAIRSYRPLPSNPNGVMISTSLQIARSLDPAAVTGVLGFTKDELPDGSLAYQHWYPAIWRHSSDDRDGFATVAPALVAKSQEVQILPEADGRSIRLPQLSPDFVDFTRGRPGWVNAVRPRFYGDKDRYAETMPSASFIDSDHYPTHRMRLQLPTREGHLTFHEFAHDGRSFDLVTMHEAIIGWLKAHDIAAEPSDAGRVADHLIASVGGIQGVGILAYAEAIKLFDSMARSRAVRPGGDSEEYPGRTASIGQVDAMIRKISSRTWGSGMKLERFIDAGVLRLGIAVRCSHCTKENWYSLDDIGTRVTCERCMQDFAFPQGSFPKRDMWKYRVVGPFATPHYAQGAYSVALTLGFLKDEIGSIERFTYATSLELKHKGRALETDFFAWHSPLEFDRGASDPSLFVGECKSFGTELFKPEDIARLQHLGELFPGAYLVATMLKEAPSESEREALKALATWGWLRVREGLPPSRLIVLTGTELLADGPFLEAWKEAGGARATAAESHRNIFDFQTLALATQEAYLGFAEREILELRYPGWNRPQSENPNPAASGQDI